ncbi:hypothetical protein [Enterococcus casseliflavus]|uniref:hypothetical protein n=1 Tax=Enterococcus casseliflavus TaxID=37734 RepID=UPI00115C8A34|nr:hypothetical protein [Enterococcus casseliflavus]
MSEVLKWLEEESDRLAEECHSNADPHKTVNNSFLEGFNYALANVQGLEQPQLNENQQIVLEWLKKQYFQGYGPAIIRTIHLLQRENSIDISGSKPVTQAYRSLNTAGEALVVKKFADWALEQEEE